MSCGFEGPRGGLCHRTALYRVHAGDPYGTHASAHTCGHHLEDTKVWVYRNTGLLPEIARLADRGTDSLPNQNAAQ